MSKTNPHDDPTLTFQIRRQRFRKTYEPHSAATATDNPEEEVTMDIFELCKEILLALLAGETPVAVQEKLHAQNVPESDTAHLINLTIAAAQAASPVIEQRETLVNAVKNLTAQGVDEANAEGLINLVINVMGERAVAQVEAANAATGENATPTEIISESTMKILMRLAAAIMVDAQNGGTAEVMIDALRKIEGIGDVKEIYDREAEFIEDVKLAAAAAERAQAVPLPQVIEQLGIKNRPAYVAVLALFFMRLKRGE